MILCVSAGVCICIREEDRRQNTQTEAQGRRFGNTPQRSPNSVATETSEDPARNPSRRGVPVSDIIIAHVFIAPVLVHESMVASSEPLIRAWTSRRISALHR